MFSWGLEIAFLLLCFSIYDTVDGNLTEALVALPFAILVLALQFYFANIKVIGGRN
jgi:hypothetical protein